MKSAALVLAFAAILQAQTANNSIAGVQIGANDSVFNTRIDALPVHANSLAWITQLLTFGAAPISFESGFGVNIVANAPLVTNATFYYTPALNNKPFYFAPSPRIRENGSYTTDGQADHHMISLDTATGTVYESYQDGGGANGTSAQSGYTYQSTSYAQPTGGTTDAAGQPLLPLILHLSDFAAGEIKHRLRVTMCAGCISNAFVWPATYSTGGGIGAPPMGSLLRLRPNFAISTFSAKAQMILLCLQHFGEEISDIGSTNQLETSSDLFRDPTIASALNEIVNAHIDQTQFEVVDESSLMMSPSSNQAKGGTSSIVTVPAYVAPSPMALPMPIRIDVGAVQNYTDSQGNVWLADTLGFESGTFANQNDNYPESAWAGVTDAQLYQTYNYTYGDDMKYGPFVAPNGPYDVTAYYSRGNCSGSFDPNAGSLTAGPMLLESNGQTMTFDVGKVCRTAISHTLRVPVTNNQIYVAMRSQNNGTVQSGTQLNALSIVPVSITVQPPGGGNATATIAEQINACGTSCALVIPPSYLGLDQVPGFSIDPNFLKLLTPVNRSFFVLDQRYLDLQMINDLDGYCFSLQCSPHAWQVNLYLRRPQNNIYSVLNVQLNEWEGGSNYQSNSLGYGDKTTYSIFRYNHFSHTPGQHVSSGGDTVNFTSGDTVGNAQYVASYGAFNATADEGTEAQIWHVLQGNVAFGGTIAAVGTGTLTINETQGMNTQGQDRFLVDLTQGYSIGSISQAAFSNSAPSTITGVGTNWPISLATGTIGTVIPKPGVATVTPVFTFGTMSAMTNASTVCVSDANAYEVVNPTAESVTGFTASWKYPHDATATFGVDGACSMLLDLTADDVTAQNWKGSLVDWGIAGTLRVAWPVISSTSTTLTIHAAAAGNYASYPTLFDSSVANNYVLYPGASISSVQQNGNLSNVLTTAPSSAKWAVNDSVEQLLAANTHFILGNWTVQSFFRSMGNGTFGAGITFNQELQGLDTMWHLKLNPQNTAHYGMHGGKLTEPIGMWIDGETSQAIILQPSSRWSIGVGCDSSMSGGTGACSGPNSIQQILAAQNASFYDFVQYDNGNKQWIITANANSSRYIFGSNGITGPGIPYLDGTLRMCIKDSTGAAHCVATTTP